MFKWLRKIFMEEKTKTETKAADQTTAQSAKTVPVKGAAPIIQREFEIAVYDVSIDDNTGKEVIKPVAFEKPVTITASSAAELQSKLSLYKTTGQIAKVIREIGQKQVASASPPNPMFQPQKDAIPTVADIASGLNPNYHAPANPYAQAAYVRQLEQAIPPRQKPRYFRVGDVEVKDDNGKIYQKQWVKLTDSEASNIRIVNDKNNAIVNLNGKHIEMKKWILVENSDDDVSDLEENL